MKLLIAYDGSTFSEAALDDLARAGLPSVGEATVISVAEVWLPPADGDDSAGYHFDDATQKHIEGEWERGRALVAAAAETADQAKARVQLLLPGWTVASAVTGLFIFRHGGFNEAHALSIVTIVTLAAAIVAQRGRTPFRRVEDVARVKGISAAWIAKHRAVLAVGEPAPGGAPRVRHP